MRLNPNVPALAQIAFAKKQGIKLQFELREEALGDKAAATAVLEWLTPIVGEIEVVETTNGRTPFLLSEHYVNDKVTFTLKSPDEPLDGLDIHTCGHEIPSLWVLNSYLASIGIRPKLSINSQKHGHVVFGVLADVEYNERRDMSLQCIADTVKELEREGYTVDVLADKEYPGLHVMRMPFKEALEHVAGASVFIGGDTGFSHVAAACGVPQVALYPDWLRAGRFSYAEATRVAEFWQLGAPFVTPSYFPNADFKYVEIGTDHKWAIESVVHAVKSLAPESLAPEFLSAQSIADNNRGLV